LQADTFDSLRIAQNETTQTLRNLESFLLVLIWNSETAGFWKFKKSFRLWSWRWCYQFACACRICV